MIDLLAKVLVLGFASAFSPVIFGVAISLLASKQHLVKRGAAYLAGAIVTAAILCVAGAAIGQQSVSALNPKSVAYIDLMLGSLFIGFAIFEWVHKDKERKINTSKRAGVFKWFALSFLMNITNFDAELLYLTEVKEIFQANVQLIVEIPLLAVGTFFFLSPIIIPFAAYIVMPAKASKVLEPVGSIMKRYGILIVSLIFFGFGAYLLFKGITAFQSL